ncbi:hypothetical protein GGX14DRAFT_403422 [Mycena pura]|uniref:Uncharacterized protein n=1 Tax=Mycena pura TaxID=153505 RepID=A0AAD6UWM2_9AGAR|nr:hypothetical protein GGX14DRAFT_403422 [Mycena pura]
MEHFKKVFANSRAADSELSTGKEAIFGGLERCLKFLPDFKFHWTKHSSGKWMGLQRSPPELNSEVIGRSQAFGTRECTKKEISRSHSIVHQAAIIDWATPMVEVGFCGAGMQFLQPTSLPRLMIAES